jgi:proteasome accessory factor A
MYLEWLAKYAESELDAPVWRQVLDLWQSTLEDLERDPGSCADRLDWVAKKQIIDGFQERDGLEAHDPKLRALDLQYHDIDPSHSLYHRLLGRGRIQRLFEDSEVDSASLDPPESTRAYFRGRCVSAFPHDLVAANWDSLVFETGEPHLRRIPMMEPLRGTREIVGSLLDDVEDAAELIEALGG